MTKQEFMAMSLPYGLKISMTKLSEYIKNTNNYDTRYFMQEFEISEHSNDFRKSYPVLHPISDLTKEIEHIGEKFVPTVNLGWNTVTLSFSASNIKMAVDTLTLREAQKLIEWHFDIAGLIEKGEAIDVNKLKENPYK